MGGKQMNKKLVTSVIATLSLILCLAAYAAAQTIRKHPTTDAANKNTSELTDVADSSNSNDAGVTQQNPVAGSESDSAPVTVTTILTKSNPLQPIDQWFEQYSRFEEVVAPQDAIMEGYRALTFYAVIEGRLQRGFALDLGDGRVVVHTTTDRRTDIDQLLEGAKGVISLALQTSTTSTNIACNCVAYARREIPSLPSIDLTTYSAKSSIINHRFPRVPSVAVIPSPKYPDIGHLAVVRNVGINFDGSLNVTIQEANWTACQITMRTGTPDGLHIQGYFDPTYPWGSASPRLDYLSPLYGPVGRQFWVTTSGINFDPSSVQAILLGGSYCNSFGKCVVPNNVMTSKSTKGMNVPLTIGTSGTYYLYFFNVTSGKTSNGKPIKIS